MTCAAANRKARAGREDSFKSISSCSFHRVRGRETHQVIMIATKYARHAKQTVNHQFLSSTRKYRYPLLKMTLRLPFAATAFFVRARALRSNRRAACAEDSTFNLWTISARLCFFLVTPAGFRGLVCVSTTRPIALFQFVFAHCVEPEPVEPETPCPRKLGDAFNALLVKLRVPGVALGIGGGTSPVGVTAARRHKPGRAMASVRSAHH